MWPGVLTIMIFHYFIIHYIETRARISISGAGGTLRHAWPCLANNGQV